jgi:hypothetical protein
MLAVGTFPRASDGWREQLLSEIEIGKEKKKERKVVYKSLRG